MPKQFRVRDGRIVQTAKDWHAMCVSAISPDRTSGLSAGATTVATS